MKLKINTIAAGLGIFFLMISCQTKTTSTTFVTNKKELATAIEKSVPGDKIIMKNGIWKDVEIKFAANGEKENPITIEAETEGKVFIEGVSNLSFGGEYLVVSGLYFRKGYSPTGNVIAFRIDKDNVANNCRVTSCVIIDFNKLQRDSEDLWVQFYALLQNINIYI